MGTKAKPPHAAPAPARDPIRIAGLPQLLDEHDVVALLGVARTTLHDWIAHGKFPQPMKLTARTKRWNAARISEWLAQHDAQSVGQ